MIYPYPSIRLNPYYALHSKLPKLEGPNKAMIRSIWFKAVNTLLRSLVPNLTLRGLLNYYPHCDNVLFALLYPDAAAPSAPANIRQVPEPIRFVLPPNPDLNDYKFFKAANQNHEDYTAACIEFWFEIMASFDDTIYSHFLSLAGAGDIMDVTLVQIFQYLYGPIFEVKTEENIKYFMDIINSPFDLNKSLLQNFEAVEQAYKILLSEAPARAPTTNSLCAIMKAKSLSNRRLHKSIENYFSQPGVTELNATFEAFRDSIIADYPKRIQDGADNIAALAFAEDPDHHTRRPAVKRFHPLAATA